MSYSKVLPWFDPRDLRNYFYLTWNFSRRCNYQCGFCPFFDKHALPIKHETTQQIADWIVLNFPTGLNYSKLSIFGGEPTLVPVQLVDAISKVNHLFTDLLLHTNLSGPLKLYRDLLTEYPNLFLVGTYYSHGESDEIFKLQRLAELAPNRVAVTIMTSHPNHARLKEVLSSVGCIVQDACLEWDEQYQNHQYKKQNQPTLEDSTIVTNDNYQQLLSHKNNREHTNRFNGWSCLAGSNSLYIEENGNLFPCRCYGQNYYRQLEGDHHLLGNILTTPELQICGHPSVICDVKKHCFDVFLTKESVDNI